MHERDTNFIGNSERRFPAVIGSDSLLMLRMEAQVTLLDLVNSFNSVSSSQRTSSESMAM